MTTLGIDFGTSNSSAAFLHNNAVTFVKDPTSHMNTFPSSVFALPSGELLVGRFADAKGLDAPNYYRQYVKRELSLGAAKILLGKQAYEREDLVAALLKHLKTLAEQHLETLKLPSIECVVLTVPVQYGDLKRTLMRNAAQRAGFTDGQVKLLQEPVAAALGYAHGTSVKLGERVLVYDLGGGTFDVAVLEYTKEGFQTRGKPDGLNWGGLQFDQLIYKDFLTRHQDNSWVQQLSNAVPTLEVLQTKIGILNKCETLKRILTAREEDDFTFSLVNGGGSLKYQLSRQQFYRMISPLVRATIECCERVLASAELTWPQIDTVLLVGGSCRMPLIREQLQRQGVGKVVLVGDPELAVCQGAALLPSEEKAHKTDNEPSKEDYIVFKDSWQAFEEKKY